MYVKPVLQNVRSVSTSVRLCMKNHYDSLGVTPKATQAQVKSAYYKLSMLCHPDKNEGSEAASKQFRDITAAYEVLGNAKLRRLYDKGLYSDVSEASQYSEDPRMKFYRSRETRTRPPPPDGRTPIYDFDEWSRQHYGATFAQDMRNKRKRKMRQYAQTVNSNDSAIEKVMVMIFSVFLITILISEDDHDKVEVKYVKKSDD